MPQGVNPTAVNKYINNILPPFSGSNFVGLQSQNASNFQLKLDSSDLRATTDMPAQC